MHADKLAGHLKASGNELEEAARATATVKDIYEMRWNMTGMPIFDVILLSHRLHVRTTRRATVAGSFARMRSGDAVSAILRQKACRLCMLVPEHTTQHARLHMILTLSATRPKICITQCTTLCCVSCRCNGLTRQLTVLR